MDDVADKENRLQATICEHPAAIQNRQLSATSDEQGNVRISKRTMRKRQTETLEQALKIHGGKANNHLPAAVGLVETLCTKFSQKQLVTTVSRKRKLCETVFPQIYNTKGKDFEKSQENVLRSIATYFCKGVMGKAKYRSVYQSVSMKKGVKKGSKRYRLKVMGCKIPSLLPYNKLMEHVKTIDLGKIGNVGEVFCADLKEEEKVNGCFRYLTDFLPSLASFYLTLEQQTEERLLWFNTPNTFQVVLGGDGAPFGKDETATAWNVSFLNRGQHILSSNENFLIFGANCSESSVPVQRYVKHLLQEMTTIENKSYSINGKDIKFKFAEFPNDLKMLAFLAGELSLSARYFSTFGNVSTADCSHVKGTFGAGPGNKWKPWAYDKRVAVAREVEKVKKQVSKQKVSEKTKRKKVTDFIASKGSRQEFEPLVGKFIDRTHVEPLHPKNNSCQQLFTLILYESIGKSALASSISDFDAVPCTSPFYKLVNCLQKKVKMGRLAKKVIRWFNENKDLARFQYRFTGQDSRLFLQNFMFIIDSIKQAHDSEKQTFSLHVFAYMSLQLRQIVSLFCRVVNVSQENIAELKQCCTNFFRCSSLFSTVTPTTWTVGHIIPAHASDVFQKYNLGLNAVSMEGREAKHMAIRRYSQNTNHHARWMQIFQHEFVHLIWLRERGYGGEDISRSKQTYIPLRVTNGQACFCGFDKGPEEDKCCYCSHNYRAQIEKSVQLGKVTVDKNLCSV